MRGAALALGLVACGPPERVALIGPDDCVPTLDDALRSRAKPIVCDDEILLGEAIRGDWLIQSAALTAHIRQAGRSVSQAAWAGGTLIDFSTAQGSADVSEIIPLIEQDDGELVWFVDATVAADEDHTGAGIRVNGTLPDGSAAEFSWWLPHGSDQLQLRGATHIEVVPLSGSILRGDTLLPSDMLVTDGIVSENYGGWVRWEGVHWLSAAGADSPPVGLLPERYVQPVAGDCKHGESVYVRDAEGRLLQKDSVSGSGVFAFLADRRATEVICTARGRTSSGWQPLPEDWEAGDDMPEEVFLEVGDFGELTVHADDLDGHRPPITVWWNGGRWTLSGGAGTLSVGAGEGTGLVSAGPAWSAADIDLIDVDEHSQAAVVLHRAIPEDALLADFDIESWPDRHVRSSGTSMAARAVTSGVQWAITVADDAIAPTGNSLLNEDDLWTSTGARADTEHGRILSWPWGASFKANQWGAPDTRSLDPHEALAVMGGGRGLTTLVDVDWVASAGHPSTWPVVPDGLMITSLDELPTYFQLLDQGTGLALVGPLTWLDGVDRRAHAEIDAERALAERRTLATTGPWLRLRIDDAPPGGQAWLHTGSTARITVDAPVWMPLDHVALVGPGGEELARYALSEPLDPRRLDIEVPLPLDLPWVMAIAWSDRTAPPLQDSPPWVATSAIALTPL